VTPAAVVANVLAHAVQVAVLVAAGGLLAWAGRLRAPAVLLRWWQTLLAAAVMLPLLPGQAPDAAATRVDLVDVVAAGTSGSGARASTLIVGVLAGGIVLRLGRLALGLRRLRASRASARPAEGALDAGVFAAAARDAGASARVLLSGAIEVPATYGLFRPVVLLPARVAALGPSVQRDVLLHELLHVRRRDWAAAMVEEVAGALLWFHPAVSWLRGRIRLAREQVVDAAVVRRTGERRRYLETLLAFAHVEEAAPAAPLFRAPHLERRVDALMKEDAMSRARIVVTVVAAAVVVAAAGAGVAAAVPLSWSGTSGEGAAKAAPRRPVHKVNAVYPAEAKKSGIEGTVEVEILVSRAGDVTSARPVKGPAELRDAAAAALRQWKFEPGDAETKAAISIRFVLDKDEKR
jgi:D-alanyl-D-alanine endopeptidase (penicillin-binding protein 7)